MTEAELKTKADALLRRELAAQEGNLEATFYTLADKVPELGPKYEVLLRAAFKELFKAAGKPMPALCN